MTVAIRAFTLKALQFYKVKMLSAPDSQVLPTYVRRATVSRICRRPSYRTGPFTVLGCRWLWVKMLQAQNTVWHTDYLFIILEFST